MTSKEALENIRNAVEYITRLDYVNPVVRGEIKQILLNAYHETTPEFNVIEKDLKFLELLKSNIIDHSVKYGNDHEPYNTATITIQVRNPKEFIENGVHYTPGYKSISDDDFKFFVDMLLKEKFNKLCK